MALLVADSDLYSEIIDNFVQQNGIRERVVMTDCESDFSPSV